MDALDLRLEGQHLSNRLVRPGRSGALSARDPPHEPRRFEVALAERLAAHVFIEREPGQLTAIGRTPRQLAR
jgi:hypothetical protein